MLPKLSEIYNGEYIGGNYAIFDISVDIIPPDIYPSAKIALGDYCLSVYGEQDEKKNSFSFSYDWISDTNPNMVIYSYINFQTPSLAPNSTPLFSFEYTPSTKTYRNINFYNDYRYCRYMFIQDAIKTNCVWMSYVTPTILEWNKFFDIIQISNNLPIWGADRLAPTEVVDFDLLRVPQDTNLKNYYLAFNRNIDYNTIPAVIGQATYIENIPSWRIIYSSGYPNSRKMIFEYINSNGSRISEIWYDSEWKIPTTPIDMSKYGVDLIVKNMNDPYGILRSCTVFHDTRKTYVPTTGSSTALSIIQESAMRVGVSIPGTIQTIVENDRSVIDKNAQLLLGGLNSTAYYSATLYDWPDLRVYSTHTITEETSELDFDTFFSGYEKMISDGFTVNDGDIIYYVQQANEDDFIRLTNLTPSEKARIDRSKFNVYVVRGGKLVFAQPLKVGITLSCTYKTRYPVIDYVLETPVPRFINDLDKSYIDTELLILGTVLNYKSYIGDDFRKEAQMFDEYAKYLKSASAGNRVIKATRQIPQSLIDDNIRNGW
jgi:hypothetical protein